MSSLLTCSRESSPVDEGISHGIRDERFTNFIRNILYSHCRFSYEEILAFCTPQAMVNFSLAMTSPGANECDNYEVLEKIGDAVYRRELLRVLVCRFPQFMEPSSVPYMARLEIILKSSQALATMAADINIRPYVTAPHEEFKNRIKPLLEDVLEAFLGALQLNIDLFLDNKESVPINIHNGTFTFVKSLLLHYKLPTTFDTLYDSKSRFNIISNFTKPRLAAKTTPIAYKSHRNDNSMFTTTLTMQLDEGEPILLGKSDSEKFKKQDSEQMAASRAIDTLSRMAQDARLQLHQTPSGQLVIDIDDLLDRERVKVRSFFDHV